MKGVLRRILQFFHQLRSLGPLDNAEREWLDKYLSKEERELFDGMSIRDSHHAVAVSKRVFRLATASGAGGRSKYLQTDDAPCTAEQIRWLVKTGLLHDVGRRAGDVGIIDKVTVVLLRRLAPRVAERLTQEGRAVYANRDEAGSSFDRIRLGFYVQQMHPVIGAEMAGAAGTEPEVVYLILNHHSPDNEDKLLKLLAEADW